MCATCSELQSNITTMLSANVSLSKTAECVHIDLICYIYVIYVRALFTSVRSSPVDPDGFDRVPDLGSS